MLNGLHGSAGWSTTFVVRKPQRQVLSRRGLYLTAFLNGVCTKMVDKFLNYYIITALPIMMRDALQYQHIICLIENLTCANVILNLSNELSKCDKM